MYVMDAVYIPVKAPLQSATAMTMSTASLFSVGVHLLWNTRQFVGPEYSFEHMGKLLTLLFLGVLHLS